MAVDMIEDNELQPHAHPRSAGFFGDMLHGQQETQLSFLGIAEGKKKRDIEESIVKIDAEVAAKYPLPKSCKDAFIQQEQLAADIEKERKYLGTNVSAGSKRIHTRYLNSFEARMANLKVWMAKSECVLEQKQEEQQQFMTQTVSTINQETLTAKKEEKTSNTLVYVVGGLTAVAVLMVVIKLARR